MSLDADLVAHNPSGRCHVCFASPTSCYKWGTFLDGTPVGVCYACIRQLQRIIPPPPSESFDPAVERAAMAAHTLDCGCTHYETHAAVYRERMRKHARTIIAALKNICLDCGCDYQCGPGACCPTHKCVNPFHGPVTPTCRVCIWRVPGVDGFCPQCRPRPENVCMGCGVPWIDGHECE